MVTSPRPRLNSSHISLWLAIFILVCLFLFKWIPDWTWRAELPEIKINNYIFEAKPQWQGATAVIESVANPAIYIRISPKKAVEERAHLKVTVNGKEVGDNCAGDADYFCHQISSRDNFDNAEYSIVAKNDAGETCVTVKVAIKPNSSNQNENHESSTSSGTVEDVNFSQPESTNPTSITTPTHQTPSSVSTNTCFDYISGVCLDDYEDEIYSAGLYDHSYGYYGASLAYPDNCDDTCKESLEDAYDEGWYDYY